MNRTPLVLVPGLLCDALLWQAQIEGLGDCAECWVADPTRSDTMHGVAQHILSGAPFERFALAGLSMGGYVALEMMRQAPGRVSRLALLDTSARADTAEQSERRLAFLELADRGRFMRVTELLLPRLLHRFRYCDPGLAAIVKTMARNVGPEAFARQQRAIMSRGDSRALLPAIACPTLVACGRQDELTPLELHEEMAAALPSAHLEVFEFCGHLCTLEQPEEVNHAMRKWLAI